MMHKLSSPSVTAATAQQVVEALRAMADASQRQVLMRFFQTGPGQYAEGDRFLGVRVPQVRQVVRAVGTAMPLAEVEKLLRSPWHEVRLCGLLTLVHYMQQAVVRSSRRGSAAALQAAAVRREEVVQCYLRHLDAANNWDLVDLSCPKILGTYLLHPTPDGALPSRDVLYRLAASGNLWRQRVAMVTCWMLLRPDDFTDTLSLAEQFLSHPHPLMHKAVGWMLREVGKRQIDVLRHFLTLHAAHMPRTALRYAIERMANHERRRWMAVPREC